jgi:hypothetical protein
MKVVGFEVVNSQRRREKGREGVWRSFGVVFVNFCYYYYYYYYY